MKVAIAGAGIAGLAAATFLARAGNDVTIYDQFDTPAPVGSGLMIQPVGLNVLAMLGLDEGLCGSAARVDRIFGHTDSGRPVLDVRYRDWRSDLCGYGVQRSTLFDLLLNAAIGAGAALQSGHTVQRADQTDDHATLTTDRGIVGPVDLVLDCLGARSPLCPGRSAPLPFGALWALLDWPDAAALAPDALSQRYRRAVQMAGILPVGTGPAVGGDKTETRSKLTFFWSLKAEDHAAWRARPLDAWKDEVRALWAAPDPGDASALDPVLAQIDAHDDLLFAQYTHRTLRRPGRGRIAHLGDSYHATSPQLGQGANMALLDAAALADALAKARSVPDATRAYGAARWRHVWLYQSASWLFTPLYQSDSRLLAGLRDNVAAPLSRVWPMPALLARLVAGRLGSPRPL